MYSVVKFVCLSVLCLGATSSFAWGRKGHDIVAEIAFRYLDSADKVKILSYLGNMGLMDAANWMDEVRGDPKYSYTAPLHYVDFPKGTNYQSTEQPNIVNALNHILDELNNSHNVAGEQIRVDLLFLIHLIGDLAQPLHVGYPDDKGGNTYQVSFLGQGSNLHRVWDSEIIEQENISFDSCYALARRITNQQRRVPLVPVNGTTIISWMNESREITPTVYPNNHKVDAAYIAKETPVIERQLALAGIELWKTLHDVAQHINAVQTLAIDVPEEVVNDVILDNLNAHVGEMVHVCGKVYGVKYMSGGGKYTFINVGAAYPNSPLTLFITEDVRNAFSYKPEDKLDGKDICVIGKLVLYNGKPEIIIHHESDIVITLR